MIHASESTCKLNTTAAITISSTNTITFTEEYNNIVIIVPYQR